MADQINWLDGQANVPGSVEKICPKRHIRQDQWQSKWKEMYLAKPGYDYISDYECIFNHPIDNEAQLDSYPTLWPNLQVAKKQGTRLSITNLAHFTEEETVFEIVASGGFKGGIKKINEDEEGNNVSPKFSWWSPKFEENDGTVQNTLEDAITPFLTDEDDITKLTSQFATSVAFLPTPQSLERYGSYYFQYGINDLCEHYGNLFNNGEVQFKILGTFGYKQEVMHAVLVCSQENGAGMFTAYPSVLTPAEDANNEAVVTRDTNGNWKWKPQATGGTKITRLSGNLPDPKYRRWEHVAFAFHIPDEIKQIAVDDPESHVNFYEL